MRTWLADGSLEDVLAEIETQPKAAWADLLATRFPNDRALVNQALIWLHAGGGDELATDTPSLGAGGERYELAVVLDTGATASVWKAYDRKLGRHVAIKVFHDAASSMIQQGLAEARASSEVISEHVVRVHDVHDANPPYIVLELVAEHEVGREGLALGASAATCRPRDLDEAVRWVRDVARGVRDAHLHDVFHRDLKPHNVLITPVSRRAKIADFGLAISAATSADSILPRLGLEGRSERAWIAGTPEYMAPEQARGLPVFLDARDPDDRQALVALDVWGLGALGYDLLCGAPPWRAEPGATAWEIAASGRAPARLHQTKDGAPIPRRLRRILERAMAPSPADRYASAREVAEELDAFLSRRPTTFDRSAASKIGLWVRRNPQLTVTAAVAVSCAAMSLATYATVVGLRSRGRALATEIHQVETDKQALAAKAREERHELDETERSLREQTASLATVRHTLSDTQAEYQTIVEAKDHELQTADVATRRLADQLASARSDRDLSEKGRELYESFWTRARADATQALAELDTARRERETVRAERDQAAKERDEARAARAQAEVERDAARTDRDREAAIRRRVEADSSQLADDLTRLRAGAATSAPPDASPPAPTATASVTPVATPAGTH